MAFPGVSEGGQDLTLTIAHIQLLALGLGRYTWGPSPTQVPLQLWEGPSWEERHRPNLDLTSRAKQLQEALMLVVVPDTSAYTSLQKRQRTWKFHFAIKEKPHNPVNLQSHPAPDPRQGDSGQGTMEPGKLVRLYC